MEEGERAKEDEKEAKSAVASATRPKTAGKRGIHLVFIFFFWSAGGEGMHRDKYI